MNPIETKEIRGITAKFIWTIIASVSAIIITVLGSFYSLKEMIIKQHEVDSIQDMSVYNLKNSIELNSLQIKEINIRLTAMEISNAKHQSLNIK